MKSLKRLHKVKHGPGACSRVHCDSSLARTYLLLAGLAVQAHNDNMYTTAIKGSSAHT